MYYKVKKYLSDNGININDVTSNFSLEDKSDGNGPFIAFWDAATIGVAEPNSSALESIDESHEIATQNAIDNRLKAYGSIEKQLEYITENGLEAWQSNVATIKALYPKP